MKIARKLTNVQRITIMVAKPAWQKLHKLGVIDEDFDTWRHRKCEEKFGHRLSDAPKKLHDDIEAHFLALGGETGKAYNRLTGPSNSERRMRHKIADLARALNVTDPGTYAQSLEPHQLRGVIINLKARLNQQQTTTAA